MTRSPATGRLIATLLATSMVAAGCSGSSGSTASGDASGTSDEQFQIGIVGTEDPSGDPQQGGVLTYAAYVEPRSLDPAMTESSGSGGGNHLTPIYDVLMRYDSESGEYEPWLAQGLEPGEEYHTWTLTLRDDVTFSDGSSLDAEAVVWSIDRYIEESGGQADIWERNVADMEVVDPSTVRFHLHEPWPDFAYLLATGPGMIVAESSVTEDGFTPVGAGPFAVEDYTPQEELVLTRHEDYWAGTPHLDGMRFIWLEGGHAKLDMLNSGQAHAAFFREPDTVVAARADGFGGAMNLLSLGNSILVNQREDSPTADVRVRQALAHAIDPALVDERAYEGHGADGNEIFQDFSRWHNDTPGVDFDPDKAQKLLEEAKKDGYDGKIRYLGVQKVSQPTALALKALFERVGFTVEIEYVRSIADMVNRVAVQQDYDLSIWSFGAPDGAVYPQLFESFHSESNENMGAYASNEMDALIEELRAAETDEAQREIIDRIQQEWNETIPALVLGARPEFVAWQQNVHGLVPSIDSLVLPGEAWMSDA